MRVKKYISIVVAVLAVMASCTKPDDLSNNQGGNGNQGGGDNSGNQGGQSTELPAPPVNVVENNLFSVDFFTTLDNSKYFASKDESSFVAYINGLSGRLPLLYMVDRTDYEVGKANLMLPMARELKATSYFAQNTRTGNLVEGTGILTKYPVKKFDGVCAGRDLFMSGCLVSAPLNQPTPVYIYTMKMEKADDFSKIFELKKARLLKDGVVVGTVKSSEKDALKKFVAQAGPLRLLFSESKSTEYDLFVLVPGAFVCRKIETGNRMNHSFYRVTIEKLQ